MYSQQARTEFFQSLLEIDRELASVAKAAGCVCGGVLDVSNYQRKPRGVGALDHIYETRFSFCCRRDGCRKRVTPASVRFLGRKIYAAMIVVLITMRREWAEAAVEVSRQTARRWRDYWCRICDAGSVFYLKKISLFAAGFKFEPPEIFASFRERYCDLKLAWSWCLRFFAPLTLSEVIQLSAEDGH
jgi:hypothetical protein